MRGLWSLRDCAKKWGRAQVIISNKIEKESPKRAKKYSRMAKEYNDEARAQTAMPKKCFANADAMIK